MRITNALRPVDQPLTVQHIEVFDAPATQARVAKRSDLQHGRMLRGVFQKVLAQGSGGADTPFCAAKPQIVFCELCVGKAAQIRIALAIKSKLADGRQSNRHSETTPLSTRQDLCARGGKAIWKSSEFTVRFGE